MKFYTKTGDSGETGLIGGRRLSKADPRVACYGNVDELNACVGVALAACPHADWSDDLRAIQSDLFILGAQLATGGDKPPGHAVLPRHVAALEERLDRVTAELDPLTHFVLPGGCELAARFHHARTVCRRAERAVVGLGAVENVDPLVIAYLNRLGDLLFAYALGSNQRGNTPNTLWIAP